MGWKFQSLAAECRSHLQRMDEWIRRKLRCVRLKQCKRAKAIADFLRSLGLRGAWAWMLTLTGKGWWRMAGSPQATAAMTNQWFTSQGLISLTAGYAALRQ